MSYHVSITCPKKQSWNNIHPTILSIFKKKSILNKGKYNETEGKIKNRNNNANKM